MPTPHYPPAAVQRTGMGICASVLPAVGLLYELGDNRRLDLKEIANYGSSQFTEKLPMHSCTNALSLMCRGGNALMLVR